MSSHAKEGAKQPAGEPPAAAGAASAPAQSAAAEAGHDEAPPADTGPAVTAPAAAVSAAAAPAAAAPAGTAPSGSAAGTADASAAAAGEDAPGAADLASADAGAMTIVLDPEPEPDEYDPDAEPVSKLAILALVSGVVALVPLAVGFGVAALVGIHRSGRRGRGMAIAGMLASAAWVIVVGAIVIVGVLTHGFKKPVTIKYHESAVFKLQEGDCINSPNGQVVAVLPCSSPHEAEVFATFTLPASAWPGTAAIATRASSGCSDRLTGYINPQLAISLTQSYVYPNKAAWTEGTRTVICEVRATSGQLNTSVRGAA
jgi:hypothetical protein